MAKGVVLLLDQLLSQPESGALHPKGMGHPEKHLCATQRRASGVLLPAYLVSLSCPGTEHCRGTLQTLGGHRAPRDAGREDVAPLSPCPIRRLEEGGRRKCGQYWPLEKDFQMRFGALTITNLGVENLSHYKKTILEIHSAEVCAKGCVPSSCRGATPSH